MNQYSLKQGFYKAVKYVVLFVLPVLVDRFVVSYPEWAQLTLGGALVFATNWLKMNTELRIP